MTQIDYRVARNVLAGQSRPIGTSAATRLIRGVAATLCLLLLAIASQEVLWVLLVLALLAALAG